VVGGSAAWRRGWGTGERDRWRRKRWTPRGDHHEEDAIGEGVAHSPDHPRDRGSFLHATFSFGECFQASA
jgi:hypothetical protein